MADDNVRAPSHDHRLPVGAVTVKAAVMQPVAAHAAYVFAHGAGAGMRHRFMEGFAIGLAERGVATIRFQFPFMEASLGRVDRPEVAHAAIRAACKAADRLLPGLPLFAGGKSFGGRMTSQAQAIEPLPGVLGLIFIGFPLHPMGKPLVKRAAHLANVYVPMLFLAGTRDGLADSTLLTQVVSSMDDRAQLVMLDDADHSFHVRRRSGGSDEATLATMLDDTCLFMSTVAGAQ